MKGITSPLSIFERKQGVVRRREREEDAYREKSEGMYDPFLYIFPP